MMADGTTSMTARMASGGGGDPTAYHKYVKVSYPYKDITSRQAGTIYRAYKDDKVQLSNTDTNIMYDIYTSRIGERTPTTDASFKSVSMFLDGAVNAIFANDYQSAQKLLDDAFDEHYRAIGEKRK